MKQNLKAKLTLFVMMLGVSVSAQSVFNENYDVKGANPESCTSIMVGKTATTDGSVITSHTCDGNYRNWMNIVPARENKPNAMVDIYKGIMHTESSTDMTGVKISGSIPDVAKTYAYLNVAYPAMNEKMLGMGETTITGRRELVNKNGMFFIEELEKIALERCATAREAITLIGKLVKEHGYGDSGECLTIADPQEVWHFEIFGEGPNKLGAVWAAVRIPDDHVGVSANIPRISKIDPKDKNNYMVSENVYTVAKDLGYWDGKEPFKWWKVFGGVKKPYAIRDYFILNDLAPELNLNMDMEELPISVKPNRKLSVMDVAKLQKSYYEGTEHSPIKNLMIDVKDSKTGTVTQKQSPYANPWMLADMANTYNALKEDAVKRPRLISVPQCSYATIIQLRSWLPEEIGGVTWLAFDNPGQSPRIPIYSGTLSLPSDYEIDGQSRYNEDAASWSFRRANKLATVKWGATRKDIEGGVARFEAKALREMPFVEATAEKLIKEGKNKEARELVTEYVYDFSASAQKYWWQLGDKFWLMFARGI